MRLTFEANGAKDLYRQITEFLEVNLAVGDTAGAAAKDAKAQLSQQEEKKPPKKKRRTKAQIEADKKKAEEEEKDAETKTPSDPFEDGFEEEPQTEVEITKDQAREALKTVHNEKGLQTTQLVLARYGVKRFIDVEEKHYPDLVKRCKDVAAGGKP